MALRQLQGSRLPAQQEDTTATVSPYDFPKKIWSLIEEYFVRKYSVDVSDVHPHKVTTRPTITWHISRRVPGGGETGRAQSRGSSFTSYLGTTPEGLVQLEYTQQQKVTYDFNVWGTNTSEIEQIAWDLEQAILQVEGVLQEEIRGLTLTFDQQLSDTSTTIRAADEVQRRGIRFIVNLPIRYTMTVPQVQFIEFNKKMGSIRISQEDQIRSTSSDEFRLSGTVTNIAAVYRYIGDKWQEIVPSIDYEMRRDPSTRIVYILWKTNGSVPSVGETFKVTYDRARYVEQTGQNPV